MVLYKDLTIHIGDDTPRYYILLATLLPLRVVLLTESE